MRLTRDQSTFRQRALRAESVTALLCLLALMCSTPCRAETVVCEVTYVAFDQVYIDKGADDGLSVGDRLEITRADSTVAWLEVAHTAAHSASCRIVEMFGTLTVGDRALVELAATIQTDTIVAEAAPLPKRQSFDNGGSTIGRAFAPRISGRISVYSSRWNDDGAANYDYTNSTARLYLTARNLGNRSTAMVVRATGRHRGQGATSSGLDDRSFSVQELSLNYANADAHVDLKAGRFLPQYATLVAHVDGADFAVLPLTNLRFGLIGAARSQVYFEGYDEAATLVGLYADYRGRYASGQRLTLNVGVVREYADADISREVIFNRMRVDWNRDLSAHADLEVDINRGWREAAAGTAMELTRARIGIRWQTLPALRTQIDYDSRRRYRDHTNRTVADSVFNDRLRQGLRGRWELMVSPTLTGIAGAGIRSHSDGENRTVSVSAGFRLRNAGFEGGQLSAEASRYSGGGENGHHLFARWYQPVHKKHAIGIGYSLFGYTTAGDPATHMNHRIDGSLRLAMTGRMTADMRYDYNTGDDRNGQGMTWSVGYSF